MSARRGIADLGLGHLRISEAHSGLPVSALGVKYGAEAGSPPLRDAVACWQGTEPERVVITTGASLGLVATLATLPRGSSILVPRPSYPAYAHVARALGLRVCSYELHADRGWLPSIKSMEGSLRADTTALLLAQPNNPTGSIASADLLRRVAKLIPGRLIISDETYAELVFDGACVPDVESLAAPVVRILSFSKLFGMPGERLGCVIADAERARAISGAHWTFAMSAPATAQLIALATLRSGPERHIRALREALARKRQRAKELLQNSGELAFTAPSGGCFLWIRVLNCPEDSAAFARRCAEHGGVIVAPGHVFGIDDPIHVRVSFAVPDAELTDGLDRLARMAATVGARRREPRALARTGSHE
jgi:aspartate/methionine/tyrosine aminotransferase